MSSQMYLIFCAKNHHPHFETVLLKAYDPRPTPLKVVDFDNAKDGPKSASFRTSSDEN